MTRVIFAGGGTGGHLYPGLAIARALVRERPSIEPFFVGARRGIERNVLPKTEFPPRAARSPSALSQRDLEELADARRRGRRLASLRRACEARPPGADCRHRRLRRGPRARVRRGASHPNRAAGGRQLSRPHGALLQPLVARDLPELSRGGARAPLRITQARSSTPARRSSRRHRRAPTARWRAQRWNFPRDRRARAAHLRRQPGFAARSTASSPSGSSAGLPDDLYIIWGTGHATYDEFKRCEGPRVRVRDYLSPIAEAYAATDFALARAGAMTTAELFAWGIPAAARAAAHGGGRPSDDQRRDARARAARRCTSRSRSSASSGSTPPCAVSSTRPPNCGGCPTGAAARARPHAAQEIARHIAALLDAR